MMECHLEVLDGYSLYIPSYWGERNAMKETIGYHDANTWYGEAGESLSVVDLGKPDRQRPLPGPETLEWSSTEDTGVDGWIRGVCVDMQVEVCILNRSDSGCYAVILRCQRTRRRRAGGSGHHGGLDPVLLSIFCLRRLCCRRLFFRIGKTAKGVQNGLRLLTAFLESSDKLFPSLINPVDNWGNPVYYL